MKAIALAIATALAVGATTPAISAPYEDQKQLVQRTVEAKQQAKAASAANQKAMENQLNEARSVDQMTPAQMQAWIAAHVQLMSQMQQQTRGAAGMSH